MLKRNKNELTELGLIVKKKLLDQQMSQTDFCNRLEIPKNRFSELLYGVRPTKKYKELIKKELQIQDIRDDEV